MWMDVVAMSILITWIRLLHTGRKKTKICWLKVNILSVQICVELRILTGKKRPKIKLQHLRKIRIWTFLSLVHGINSF